LIRAVYSHSSDKISTGVDALSGQRNPDTSGFNFKDVDLAFWGSQGPYRWRISADLDGNRRDNTGTGTPIDDSLDLEDAHIVLNCSGYFDAMMGQFKPHVTRSNSVDPEKQVMLDRTSIGSAFDFWDLGVGVFGVWEYLNWYASLLNGQDSSERDHTYFVRGEFNLGQGAGSYEGAMGSSDQLNATAGLTLIHDDTGVDGPDSNTSSDSTSWIADFNGNVSNAGFGVEVADFDDDAFLITGGDYNNISDSGDGTFVNPFPGGGTTIPGLLLAGDSNPWNATFSYLINPEWEVAARFEDLDNGDNAGPDNTVLSLGATWYRGNAGKWQAQFSMIDADSGFNDGDVLEVGYAVGTTR